MPVRRVAVPSPACDAAPSSPRAGTPARECPGGGLTGSVARMRRRTLLTALPFLCAALACGGPTVRSEARPAALSIGPALRAIPVADTPAWLIVHDARIPATSLLYLTRDGSPILADTPWTPEATRALLAWIRLRFGRPPALATISHFHLDAAGGIAALREAEVPVVASTHTAELLAARGPGMREQVAALLDVSPDDLVLGAPDVTFDEAAGFERTVGGTQVRVIYPGAAHAPDNIVDLLPRVGRALRRLPREERRRPRQPRRRRFLLRATRAPSRACKRWPPATSSPATASAPTPASSTTPRAYSPAAHRDRRVAQTHVTTCRWAVGVNSGASPGEGIMGGRVVHEPDEEHRRGAHQRCSVLGCP